MILDVGAQASVVVAADKRLDLTERVLARLKSQSAAATSRQRSRCHSPQE